MVRKAKNQTPASALKFKADALPYTFTAPQFEHNGKVYVSADLLTKAEAGNDEALTLLADLVQMGSGVIKQHTIKN